MTASITLAWVAALGLAVLGVVALSAPATALGLVDRPGGRKVHARSVPLIGGVAILLGFGLASLLLPIGLRPYAALYAGLAVIALSGLIDDAIGLPAHWRLLAQLVMAVLVVVAGGPILTDIGSLPGVGLVSLGVLAAPITVIAIVGFVNSLNMMDGADGLAGGASVLILVGLSIAAWLAGNVQIPALALTLAAAVMGFLVFNLRTPWRRRASVFLGDGGSLALGFAVIWLALETAALPGRVISPMGIAWLLAVPVVETLNLIVRRLMRGKSPFHPDREHLHHILRRAGFSVGQTTWLILGLMTVMAAVGLKASRLGVADGWLWLGLFGFGLMHFVFTDRGWRSVLALKRLRDWHVSHPEREQLRGVPLSPLRQRFAVAGFYLFVATLPFGLNTAWLGLAMVSLAVMLPGARFTRSVVREWWAWAMIALAAWVIVQGWRGGVDPLALWHCVAMSGVAALPLGWWLASSPRHVLSGAGVLIVAVVVSVSIAGVSEGLGTVAGIQLAGPDQLMLLAMPLPLCLAVLVRQLERCGRGWLQAGPLALLAVVAAAALLAALIAAPVPLVLDVKLAGSDVGQLLRRAGLPAVALLAVIFAGLIRSLWPLYRARVLPRYSVVAVALLAVMVLISITLAPAFQGVEGGQVFTLAMAVLCMAAIQYRRWQRGNVGID
jgi:UDP-GlcNAc:undecaprenyl-phosphate GlcNAc-1-phosphate transferase